MKKLNWCAVAFVAAAAVTVTPTSVAAEASDWNADQIFQYMSTEDLARYNYYGSDFVVSTGPNGTFVSVVNSACDFPRNVVAVEDLLGGYFGKCTFNSHRGLPLSMVLSAAAKDAVEDLIEPSRWDEATEQVDEIAKTLTIVDDPEYPQLKGTTGSKALLLPGKAGEREVTFSFRPAIGQVENRTITLVTPPRYAMSDWKYDELNQPKKQSQLPSGNVDDGSSTAGILLAVVAALAALAGIAAFAWPQLQSLLP